MTHQRDLERKSQSTNVETDARTPGRQNASHLLRVAVAPLPSGIVMRSPTAAQHEADASGEAVASATSSSGHALPGELRERFEGSLGTDLGDVRVHTGSDSQ